MGCWPAPSEGWGQHPCGGVCALIADSLVAVGLRWLAGPVPLASRPASRPAPTLSASVRLHDMRVDSRLIRPVVALSRFPAYAMTMDSKGIWTRCNAIAGSLEGRIPKENLRQYSQPLQGEQTSLSRSPCLA
jgi:hypothetical protein